MLKILDRYLDKYLGRGAFSITVPPFDGALMPNERLEKSERILTVEAPDCLAMMGGDPVVSSRARILNVRKKGEQVAVFDAEITCMASLPAGELAVGLTDGRIAILNGQGRASFIKSDQVKSDRVKPEGESHCPTAMVAADSAGNLFVTHGSSTNPYHLWKRDLMEKNRSGSVWRVETATGKQTQICGGLAFPYGLCMADNALIVAESWRSRLLRLPLEPGRGPEVVLDHLPGYLSRISPAREKGFWLTAFAPRSQLVEFVLREDRYRRLMVAGIDPDFWVAPALRSNTSFYEPLQAGGVKQLGIMKPWSPARSYGLVIRLDEAFQPRESLHSRADGSRHGITSCLEYGEGLLMAVKGDGMVASYPIDSTDPIDPVELAGGAVTSGEKRA